MAASREGPLRVMPRTALGRLPTHMTDRRLAPDFCDSAAPVLHWLTGCMQSDAAPHDSNRHNLTHIAASPVPFFATLNISPPPGGCSATVRHSDGR
jgi:hypothetical protein